MIRNGTMGTNYETKLIISIVALIICLYDWFEYKRYDYFWVFLFGTIIWTSVEFSLQITGMRDIVQASLFGTNISPFVASVLRGTMEGTFPAVVGIFFADRVLDKEKRKIFLIIGMAALTLFFLVTLLQGKPYKDIGGDVASEREIFTPFSLIFLNSIFIFNVIWLWKKATPEQRTRVLLMFVVMFLITAVFNVGEYIANTRWIQVESDGKYYEADPLLEFFALHIYNNIIEFASMYVIFIIIPYELKLIKTAQIKVEEPIN
ncbi:MAG: hypothetical protein ACFFDK_16185 [Promethearchaeota archaeon]